MRRFSPRAWWALGILGLGAVVALGFALRNLREPQALRYRLDLTERGTALEVVTVFHLEPDSLQLVPRQLHVAAGGSRRARAQDLVAYLTEAEPPARPPLPPGTELLHFFEDGAGEAVLDFNAEVERVDAVGIQEERLKLVALVRTIDENLDGVERLRILVHGRPLETWGRHLRLEPTLEVDEW